LGDIEGFPFIEPPDTRSIKDGIGLLHELGAITDAEPGTRKWLTPIGVTLARLPLDPRLGRMVLAGNDNACLDEVLTIVSSLAIQDPRERPLGKEEAADQMHRRFMATASDLTGLLALWDHIRAQRNELTSNQFRSMCRKEYLNWRRVREWQDIRAQLRRVVADLGMTPNREPATPELIHESILAGLLSHVGKKDPDGWGYRGARGMTFSIRPGSVLFKAAPEWVMAAELVTTTRTWAAGVAAIDPAMIERVGAHLINRTLSDPWWDAPRGSAVARETATLLGMTISSDRIVQLDRFDPDLARTLFIRHALVAGEWETHHAFAAHNEERISEVIDIETRERREDLLIPDDELAAIFDRRIPHEVTSVATFDRWWRDARSDRPDLLDLTIDDLIAATAASVDEDAFPAEWGLRRSRPRSCVRVRHEQRQRRPHDRHTDRRTRSDRPDGLRVDDPRIPRGSDRCTAPLPPEGSQAPIRTARRDECRARRATRSDVGPTPRNPCEGADQGWWARHRAR
jgi:ATP-dependent helicase HrpA